MSAVLPVASSRRRRRGPHNQASVSSSRDASEEDNDELEPISASSHSKPVNPPSKPHALSHSSNLRHKKTGVPAASLYIVDDGVDSPNSTYDGDVESSMPASMGHHSYRRSSLSSIVKDIAKTDHHTSTVLDSKRVPAVMTEQEIRSFVEEAVAGNGLRPYRINQPPTDRPVRIYADGVYDLFHFGHALQMRQAKLCFPSVHLLIGVCSDELCSAHKSAPAMSHAERCESVRHCKWVDEVVPEAPWEITQEFLDQHQIDYVAHDDEPYKAAGKDDVYQFVKDQGKFLPTRRTPGISTSSLLERIVLGYRDGFFDSKLEKNGHGDLKAELVDWESSSSAGRRGRTLGAGTDSPQ